MDKCFPRSFAVRVIFGKSLILIVAFYGTPDSNCKIVVLLYKMITIIKPECGNDKIIIKQKPMFIINNMAASGTERKYYMGT